MSLDFYRAKSKDSIDFNNEFVELEDEDEAMEFFVELEELCENALECNQKIFAIGD